jgi:hypothetical protein
VLVAAASPQQFSVFGSLVLRVTHGACGLCIKIVSAGRRNQHPGWVRSPKELCNRSRDLAVLGLFV